MYVLARGLVDLKVVITVYSKLALYLFNIN